MELPLHAQDLNEIGVTLLRSVATNTDGTGIRVAQPEAPGTNIPPDFEVNPAYSFVQKPAGLFTYFETNGTASFFPNSLGTESGHADTVASNFYGFPGGVATNVVHVDNYEANYFYNNVIAAGLPPNINDAVVNQSFTDGLFERSVTDRLFERKGDYPLTTRIEGSDRAGNPSLRVLESFCETAQGVRFRRHPAQSEQSLIQFLSQYHCIDKTPLPRSVDPPNLMGKPDVGQKHAR